MVNIEIVKCKISDNSLADVMKARGLSQEETAHRARMTARQLSRIVQRKNCPSLEKAKSLSVVLRTPLDQLFQFEIVTRAANPSPISPKSAAALKAWETRRAQRATFRQAS